MPKSDGGFSDWQVFPSHGSPVSFVVGAAGGVAVLEGLVCVYCAREGGACGVALIPLECAPNLY